VLVVPLTTLAEELYLRIANKSQMKFSDLISGIGAGLILLAFMLMTFRLLSEKSKLFYAMNLFGGAFAFWGCLLLESVPFAVLEGTWALVAAVGLMRALKT
jgi:hypothetical protein